MLPRIVRDSALGSQKQAGQFGAQFLACVILIAESVGVVESLPIQPVGVPGPVRQLVESGAVIARRVVEQLAERKMDGVGGTRIEGAVGLIVCNFRARVPKDLLAGFDGGESGMSPRLLRGNSINLFGVENGVDAMYEPGFTLPPGLLVVGAVTGGERLAIFAFGPLLPKFDLCSFFTAPNLPVVGGGLFVCHPARVVIAFADRRRHQVDGIAAAIWIVGGGVEGDGEVANRRRIPRFLPRGHALLQHLDDGYSGPKNSDQAIS